MSAYVLFHAALRPSSGQGAVFTGICISIIRPRVQGLLQPYRLPRAHPLKRRVSCPHKRESGGRCWPQGEKVCRNLAEFRECLTRNDQ